MSAYKKLTGTAALFVIVATVSATPVQARLELWVADGAIGRVDGYTGEFLGYVLQSPPPPASRGGFAFGPDGNLYVVDSLGDRVARYDGETFAFMDYFVEAGSGGVEGPVGLVFSLTGTSW